MDLTPYQRGFAQIALVQNTHTRPAPFIRLLLSEFFMVKANGVLKKRCAASNTLVLLRTGNAYCTINLPS
jgi:hypothetical protein